MIKSLCHCSWACQRSAGPEVGLGPNRSRCKGTQVTDRRPWRRIVQWLGIKPLLAPLSKARPHGSGLGKTRYVVERTLSWFGNFRRLKLCYERCGTHFQAFHELAAAILCSNRLAQ